MRGRLNGYYAFVIINSEENVQLTSLVEPTGIL
jgi:hypothetical protein